MEIDQGIKDLKSYRIECTANCSDLTPLEFFLLDQNAWIDYKIVLIAALYNESQKI